MFTDYQKAVDHKEITKKQKFSDPSSKSFTINPIVALIYEIGKRKQKYTPIRKFQQMVHVIQ